MYYTMWTEKRGVDYTKWTARMSEEGVGEGGGEWEWREGGEWGWR